MILMPEKNKRAALHGPALSVCLVLFSGCALLPAHYVLENHFVRERKIEIGRDHLWIHFDPTYTYPTAKLVVYGNPYGLNLTVYADKKYDSLGIMGLVVRSRAGDTLFAEARIRLKRISDSATGKGIEGRQVYSAWNRGANIKLPVGTPFTVDFDFQAGAGTPISIHHVFDWNLDRENRNKSFDAFMSI